jgi:hypothetical protein
MDILKLHLSLELPNGTLIKLESCQDLGNMPLLFSDLEKLVSGIGHSVLPELEQKLLEQMSRTFVGEKNEE